MVDQRLADGRAAADDDVVYGEAQDDDLIGGWGHDWISGGSGDDGVLGDDGRIYTSRNATAYGEPLYGIAAIASGQLGITISTPGNLQTALINVENELKKTVDLTPFNVDPGTLDNPLFDPAYADDLIYGGTARSAGSCGPTSRCFSRPRSNAVLPFPVSRRYTGRQGTETAAPRRPAQDTARR